MDGATPRAHEHELGDDSLRCGSPWHLICSRLADMLEIARPETRSAVRAQPRQFTWGIVDVILAVVILPFAIWVWIIDRMVWAIAKLQPQ